MAFVTVDGPWKRPQASTIPAKFRVETRDGVQFVPFETVAAILRHVADKEFLRENYSNDAQALEVAAPVMQAASNVMAKVARP